MKKFILFAAAVLAVSAVRPTLAVAQRRGEERATRSVQGVVTDSSEAMVEGAVVQIKDTKSLQVRSFITRQDGAFHFHGLNPDIDYELRAERQGSSSSSKTLSAFDSRKTAVINLKLEGRK